MSKPRINETANHKNAEKKENNLENIKFDKLETLHLSGNEISDINILEKVNFSNLKIKIIMCKLY